MGVVKLAVIYYSSTGANYQLAQWAVEGAKAAGAEVKLFRVAELAPDAAIDSSPVWRAHADATKHIPVVTTDDLLWADAYVFSCPTRYGNLPSQMKQFIDTTGGIWAENKLNNKVVSAMATSGSPHGGQEATILNLYTIMYHWGAIVAAPGYSAPVMFTAGGNPYGISSSVDDDGNLVDDVKEAVHHQAQRTVLVAGWVKAGLKEGL